MQIVASDDDFSIVDAMEKDAALADAVGVVGVHKAPQDEPEQASSHHSARRLFTEAPCDAALSWLHTSTLHLTGRVLPSTVPLSHACLPTGLTRRRSVGAAELPNLFTFEFPITQISQPNHAMIWLRPTVTKLKIITLAHQQIHLAVLVDICGDQSAATDVEIISHK